MADLHFELVTPDRLVMSDDVYMVVVPGTPLCGRLKMDDPPWSMNPI